MELSEALRQSMSQAMQCASSDSMRYVLNGAFLDVSKPDAHYVVATDGRHLFSSNSFTIPLNKSLIIPEHKFLAWKGFTSDGDWKLRCTTGKDKPGFEITSDRWRFTSRSIEGSYPNWKNVLPDPASFKTTIAINPDALEDLSRAVLRLPTYSEINPAIGLEVKDHRFILLGKSQRDMEWSKIAVDRTGTSGPPVMVLVNKQFLLKALRFGLTRIEITDAISPIRFSQGGRQMIVMPIRPDPVTSAAAPQPKATPSTATDISTVTTSSTTTPPPPAEQLTETITTTNNGKDHPAEAESSNTTSTTVPANAKAEPKPALEAALVQIETLRTGFREAIGGLTKLGDTLRQALREQKAGDKDIQSVRQTLRSLQGVRL